MVSRGFCCGKICVWCYIRVKVVHVLCTMSKKETTPKDVCNKAVSTYRQEKDREFQHSLSSFLDKRCIYRYIFVFAIYFVSLSAICLLGKCDITSLRSAANWKKLDKTICEFMFLYIFHTMFTRRLYNTIANHVKIIIYFMMVKGIQWSIVSTTST